MEKPAIAEQPPGPASEEVPRLRRLLEEARVRMRYAGARLEGLQALTLALAGALTPEAVARAVVEEAVRTLDARDGGLFVPEPRGVALRLVHAVGYSPATREHFGRVPLGAALPVADAVRTGQPVWLHHRGEYAARYPAAAASFSSGPGDISIACLPLVAQGVLGCLALSFDGPHAFDAEQCAWLEALARQCAMALERARLFASQQRQAERAGFLERFTAALASSLELEETARRVAALVLPELGDVCLFDMHPAEGPPRRLARVHARAERQGLLEGLEWTPAEVPGEAVFQPHVDGAWLSLVADQAQRARLGALSPDSVVSVPLWAQQRVVGTLTLLHAGSGRRHSEEDWALVQELGRRAAVAVDTARLFHQAHQAIQVRDEFLAIAGHELNTPLTALTLQLTRLQRTTDEESTRARVELARRQVDRLGKLVRELLDVGRISEGRLRLEPEEVDLVALCREVLGHLGDEMTRSGTAVHLWPRGPVVGQWDRSRLDQLVTNLVSNALKYGGGRPVELEVALDEGARRARLEVRDSGMGIAPEQQARLFQRFERAVSVRHYGGFGLGLWVVRQVVEAHGGHISLRSAPGQGTTVTVELPLSPPAPAP